MNIIITDDHTLYRAGLKLMLEQLATEAMIQEVGNAYELTQLLREQAIDLLILDLQLPDQNGLSLLEQLHRQYPQLRIAIHSSHEEPAIMQQSLHLGAQAYVPKSLSTDIMRSAWQLILSGGSYIPAQLSNYQPSTGSPKPELTPRQYEILQLLAKGYSNKQICAQLHLAQGTIKTHLSSLFRLLSANNRTQAVRIAQQLNLLNRSS